MATEDILRVNYTEGQFLTAADLIIEQTYMDESRRRHYISEHTWGIVAGLSMVKNASNIWVVGAGMAIDGYGREIYVFEDEPLDTTEIAAQLAGQANATLEIWIAYSTETTAPAVNGYASCVSGASNTRIRESFLIIYQDHPPPFDNQDPEDRSKYPVAWQDLPDDPVAQPWPVFLGRVMWTAGAITGVDPAGRHYAGLTGVEVYSQTAQFDVHASTLRIRVEGANDAILTTNKSAAATAGSDLHIRTNDANGGNTVQIDKDNLAVAKNASVDQKIVVKGTVGTGSGKLYVEPDTLQDLATLTRPANAGAGPTHDLAIRTNDGNGGNHILLDKDDVTAQSLSVTNGLTVSGASVVKGGMELWGGQLLFKQSDGTDDTDPMAISRFNNAPDRNDFRIQIGDNLSADDRLVVGPVYFGDGQFKEQFVVDNQGNIKAAGNLQTTGAVNGRNMTADGAKLDGVSAGATCTAVLSGILDDGAVIPLPAGYTESQCKWIVSPNTPDLFLNNYLHDFYCDTTTGRTVYAKWIMPGSPPNNTVPGSVNYLIIGVK